MALTKETVIDQITVTENGIVLYREATRIMEDGVQLSQTYHRTSLTPGQDLTGQPEQARATDPLKSSERGLIGHIFR